MLGGGGGTLKPLLAAKFSFVLQVVSNSETELQRSESLENIVQVGERSIHPNKCTLGINFSKFYTNF